MSKFNSLFKRSLDDDFNYNSIERWAKEFTIDKSHLDEEFNLYSIYLANSFLKKEITFWEADSSLWNIMGILDHKLPNLYWDIAVKFEDYETNEDPENNIINSLEELLDKRKNEELE